MIVNCWVESSFFPKLFLFVCMFPCFVCSLYLWLEDSLTIGLLNISWDSSGFPNTHIQILRLTFLILFTKLWSYDNIFAGMQYSQQSYKVSDSFPFKWINKKWKEGFHVTSMATAGSRWAVVMSRNAGFSDQVELLSCTHSYHCSRFAIACLFCFWKLYFVFGNKNS